MIRVRNIKQFETDLGRFAKKINVTAEAAATKVTLDLFKMVVIRTPVDTGYARANWTINPNSPNNDVLIEKDDAKKSGKDINYEGINRAFSGSEKWW